MLQVRSWTHAKKVLDIYTRLKPRLFFSDSTGARALEAVVDAGNTTVESCVAACQARGYSLAGVEFGKECCEFLSFFFFTGCRVRSVWGGGVLTDGDCQFAVQSFSMVRRSLETTMGSSTGTSVRTPTQRTATWVVKETRVRPVAVQPCWMCTILRGRIPSEPRSCLPSPSVRGLRKVVTGTVQS